MGERIRLYDWSATPLGPIALWPQSLKTSLSLILNAQMPMWLGWTRQMYFFYNDAYVDVLSHAKHPWALGRPASEVWSEIWHVCGPLADSVFARAEAPFLEDVRLFMDRGEGFFEEVYYSFSYSPIRDESGGVAGLFCPNTDVTAKLIHARRLRTLSDLNARALAETTMEAALLSAAATLTKNTDDFPFALLYLADGQALERRAAVRVPAGFDDARWKLDEAFAERRSVVQTIDPDPQLPLGLADMPVHEVVALPIAAAVDARPLGVLVAGVNPTRRLDAEHLTFFELVARQVATALQNARAAEETKRRADALAELDRAKTVFFSNVSHEFRTPLTLMLGPTEDALSSPERTLAGAALETVYRNELRLLKLVNALLDFSRLEAGRMKASYESVDVIALTADLANGFRAAIERAGLGFQLETQPLAGPIALDRDMWEKIVLNLLSNAVKFTLAGSICVRVYETNGQVTLEVADTGTGIPASELPRLFERFHRVENPHARTQEGAGIGLALVHELVHLLGGEVSVESEVGRGSTFRVAVPARATAMDATLSGLPSAERRAQIDAAERMTGDAAPQVPGATSSEHILLADDNADMRDYLQRLLAPHFRVTAVENGALALAAAISEPPDLVLSDVMMPELDGFGLLTALHEHEQTRHVPVILVSARAGEESRVEGLAAGADDYLVKPFSARELVARVKTHLALARARKAAERSHEDLYALMMQVPAAILVRRGHELRCVFQNHASVALLDQRGKTLREVWPDEPPDGLTSSYARVLETGETVTARELPVTRAWTFGEAPSTRYFDLTWAAVREPDGPIERVMSVSFDVTERVLARQQASAADEHRRRAFDAAGVGTWRIDVATWQHTRDAVLNRILGLPEQETTQLLADSLSYVHPDDRRALDAAIEASITRGEDYKMEVRMVRPDRSLRWLRKVGRIVRDDAGRPLALTGTAVDITDRKLAEDRARDALDRLEAALAASQIGTYSWHMATQRVQHDAGIQRLFGFTPDGGEQIEDYTARIHPDDRSRWLAELEVSARQGTDFEQEYRVVRDDGVRWLLDKGHVVCDATGPAYMVGAVVDITELKRLATAAMAANRAKDEFLAMLGHELRNPLAPIVTALQIMKLRGAPETKERTTLERQVKHLVRLVDDLLDISRVIRGLIDLHRERLSLRDLITKAIEMASPMIEQKQHQLSVDLPADLFVDGDAVRLAQVFANLLTNAARYTPARGQIAVSASGHGDRIYVRVRDNGNGIAAEQLESIFELFVQGGDNNVARSGGGLGIGLALARNLLDLHGGSVSAKSDGLGMGSTFTVELPAAAAPELARVVPSPAALPTTARRVLVVDDNADAAEMLATALAAFGHEVVVAHDGPHALELVERFWPDAAVLDIGLPVMDGHELARRLRARGLERCFLVAVTGYGQDEDRVRSQEAGFDAHLVKPVDLMGLANLLETRLIGDEPIKHHARATTERAAH